MHTSASAERSIGAHCGWPRRVAALGDCALGCNVLGTKDAVVGSVEAVLAVDLRIPGCPPRPDAIAEALLQLIDESPS